MTGTLSVSTTAQIPPLARVCGPECDSVRARPSRRFVPSSRAGKTSARTAITLLKASRSRRRSYSQGFKVGAVRARRPAGYHCYAQATAAKGGVVTSQRPTSQISPDSLIAIAKRPTSRLPRRPMRPCGSASRPRPRRQRNKNCGCDGPHAHRGAPRATISAAEEAAHATSVAATERTR